MKAVIRSDKGVEYVALLSETYDDAVKECVGLQEDGIIKADEYVEAIVE